MNIKQHLILITVCIGAWLLYLLLGLPSDYYLNYSAKMRVFLAIATFLFFIPPITIFLLRFISFKNLFITSLFLSFYATVGIFILDYLYCGIYQGYGLAFMKSHWLQTSGYFFPWLEIPIIGYIMENRKYSSNQGIAK